MPRLNRMIPVLPLLVFTAPLLAAPRDAEATLNRCGRPLKGDITEYTNTSSHRVLRYERGTLTFERLGNDGWTFDHGMRKGQDGLDATAMEVFMPCLKDALADSASPNALPKMTSAKRLESSMKRSYRKIIVFVLLGLLLVGVMLFLLSKRKRNDDDLVG